MNVQDAAKVLLERLVNRGDNLCIYANNDPKVSGKYVTGHGGYTVIRKQGFIHYDRVIT